jgi:hypothetical protein
MLNWMNDVEFVNQLKIDIRRYSIWMELLDDEDSFTLISELKALIFTLKEAIKICERNSSKSS